MVGMKIGIVMQHRSFPNGEREGDRGLLNRIVVAQECDPSELRSQVSNKLRLFLTCAMGKL